jgi:hypothetical protein
MSVRSFACRAGRAEQRADGLAVHLPEHARTELLAPLAAVVWQAADGRTDLAGLLAAAQTVEPTADVNRLWLVLDVLADADLLESRLAPPGPALDRRGWLRTIASAAAVAVVGLAMGPQPAQAKKRKESEAALEQNKKAAERKQGGGGGREQNAKAQNEAPEARRARLESREKAVQPERAEARRVREEAQKRDQSDRSERRQGRESEKKAAQQAPEERRQNPEGRAKADSSDAARESATKSRRNQEQSDKATPGARESSRKRAEEEAAKATATPGAAEAQPATATPAARKR